MRKIIILSLSLVVFAVIFISCDDDDKHPFNGNILGEWEAVDIKLPPDSIGLAGYVFNADMTGRVIYDFYGKNGDIGQFSILLKDLNFNSETQIALTSQTYRIRYEKAIRDIVFNEKRNKDDTIWMDVPQSVIVNESSYWRYVKYIKYLDEDSLVFTDRHGIEEYKYRKIR